MSILEDKRLEPKKAKDEAPSSSALNQDSNSDQNASKEITNNMEKDELELYGGFEPSMGPTVSG